MSYTKTNWQTGDIVTAEKLNKIENQLEKTGGVLVCHLDEETGVLDHTWAEINAADVVVMKTDDFNIYIACYIEPADPENEVYNYVVGFRALNLDFDTMIGFTCNTETDYPVVVQDFGGDGGGNHQT